MGERPGLASRPLAAAAPAAADTGGPGPGGACPEDEAGTVDLCLRGEGCPYTFLKAKLALEPMRPGAGLRIVVDNPESARDVPRSLAGAGHHVVAVEAAGPGAWAILVRRG